MWRTAVVPATSETEAGETKTIGSETLTWRHSEIPRGRGGGGRYRWLPSLSLVLRTQDCFKFKTSLWCNVKYCLKKGPLPHGTRERAQKSRTLVAFPGDSSSGPRAPIRCLTIACKSRSRRANVLFWLPQAPVHSHTHKKAFSLPPSPPKKTEWEEKAVETRVG